MAVNLQSKTSQPSECVQSLSLLLTNMEILASDRHKKSPQTTTESTALHKEKKYIYYG